MKVTLNLPSLKNLNWRRGLTRCFLLAWALFAWLTAGDLFKTVGRSWYWHPLRTTVSDEEYKRIMDEVFEPMIRKSKDAGSERDGSPTPPLTYTDIEMAVREGTRAAAWGEGNADDLRDWFVGPVATPGLLLLGWWTVRGFRREKTTTPPLPTED